ncbi:antibiotic biosynthesis monooxygenase [Rhodopirellula sp. JC740]|uniref:Antibiotic biosynthesis monooxygenase n=1 Tax=Rhodopirellula halodulae TaxID=2894198 RepID=A0ABS8NM96_9BACT|nr:antibiotic biosynthesis monooxygenase [Rhodopirellula sp. JC740]MCC9644704.1 antibiotic biosynthesis monooxygenase [Rhodopirellula sp. JC740]
MAEDNLLASTPPTPYYAVVFTSCRTAVDDEGYSATAERMLALAAEQDGYLGVESVRDGDGGGITVSYWRDLDAIARWRAATEHRQAQSGGRAKWYEQYRVRVCRVEREYGFGD